jgi:hypothetical protein
MWKKGLTLISVVCVFFARIHAQQPGSDLKFIENKNQWSDHYDFGARIPGGNMLIEPGKFSYYFVDTRRIEELHEEGHHSEEGKNLAGEKINAHSVTVRLAGANRFAVPQPFGRSDEYYNYFVGDDQKRWAADAHAYEGMIYPEIYKNVDLKVYSSGDNLKYDFIVAPGGDPAQIVIQYQGADRLLLDNGNLTVRTSIGEMIERKPFVYQIISGCQVEVASEYRLAGTEMTFSFPEGYDACYELVIDPVLIFSTYSGSKADNWGSTATPGENGNLYSSGVTNHFLGDGVFSGTFPATPGSFQINYGGAFDVAILKYDSIGSQLLYASYLGGAASESPHSLLMNANEELIVLGTTSSTNFPTTNGVISENFNGGTFESPIFVSYDNGSDLFISRISRDGKTLLASTYLGGSSNDGLNAGFGDLSKNYGDEMRGDVITDAQRNIYVSSVTSSEDFPMTSSFDTVYNGGATDAILVKLSPGLDKILWGAFIGGSSTDAAHTIKFDSNNNIFVAGGTVSNDLGNTISGFQSANAGDADGWIAKISNDGGSVFQMTYTGTNNFDQIYFLDLNDDDEVYVYGQTAGAMPITGGVFANPGSGQFLQKFSNDLKTRIFSTTFGSGRGIPDISPTAFLVSDCNSIYMSGWGGITNSQDNGGWGSNTFGMQTTPDAFQSTTSGSDFYFIVLGEDASTLLYATYLGGTQSRTHVDGGTSRFDKEGVVYHSVCSGCQAGNATDASTSDFPTTAGAWSRTNQSKNCNNAAFKFDLASLKARLEIEGGISKICLPDKFTFNNRSSGGIIYHWIFGDGQVISRDDQESIEYEYDTPGEYLVRLVAYDPATCIISDTAVVKVNVYIPEAEVQSDDNICGGTPYQLRAQGGVSYHWYTEDGSFQSDDQSPMVTPRDTTLYFVDIVEASGCLHTNEVLLNVVPDADPDFDLLRETGCTSRPYIVVKNTTDSSLFIDEVYFDFGDGVTSDASEIDHLYEKDSLYTVKLIVNRLYCVFEKSVQVPAFTLTVPNVITPGLPEGYNDTFVIQYGKSDGGVILTPQDFGYNVELVVYNRWGDKVYESGSYKNDWSGADLGAGVYYYELKIDDHVPCKSWVQVVK